MKRKERKRVFIKGGLQKLETGCEMKRKERKRVFIKGGGGGGGGQMKGLGQLMALSAYLMAGSKKEKI